jgi:arylsulfatase A-like enzyme
MNQNDIVVIAVDGLGASALGAYGNTWFETPCLDDLACESVLAEWCFAPATDLDAVYRSLWTADHPLRMLVERKAGHAPTTRAEPETLPQLLANQQYHTTLLSDDTALQQYAGVQGFADIAWLSAAAAEYTNEPAETHFAQMFAHASQLLTEQTHLGDGPAGRHGSKKQFLWIHLRGMMGPWDAPLNWRQALCDDDDPMPYDGIIPPCSEVEGENPDELFRFACAHASQVQLLDTCLGAFCDSLRLIGNKNGESAPLLVIVGTRGFPLGEHGCLGHIRAQLHTENVHVPLLIRFPDKTGQLHRIHTLVETGDVMPTLLDWVARGATNQIRADGRSLLPLVEGSPTAWRDHTVSISAGGLRAIRSPSWCLQENPGDVGTVAGNDTNQSPRRQLFLRPDDYHEINDVSDLRGEVVDGLVEAIRQFERACQQNEPLDRPLLDRVLREPVG